MGRNKKMCNKYKKLPKNQKSQKHNCKTSDIHIWDKHFSSFQSKMLENDLFLKDIKGDGNCLFRAIADQIEGDEGKYKKYRELSVEELKEDQEFFKNFIPDDITFEKYLSIISTDGVWGGNIELQALSKGLGVNFVIHMIDRPAMIMSNEHENPQIDGTGNIKYLHLAYHYGENIGEHYSSVRNLNDVVGPASNINFQLLQQFFAGQSNENYEGDIEIGSFELGEEEKNEECNGINEQMEKLEINEQKNSPLKQKNKKEYPRNKKCYCGSKKSYKNCCLVKEEKEEEKKKNDEKEIGKKNGKHLLILV